MKLLTAHRILIGSAIAMFIVYGGQRIADYASGNMAGLVPGVLSIAAVIGLSWYYRSLRTRYPRRE